MIRKKLVYLGIGVILLLTGCSEKSGTGNLEGKKYEDYQSGLSGRICESPEGYYMIMGNYLVFAEKDLEKATVVCDKADCLHQEEEPDNRLNCNAFFSTLTSIGYANGKVYVLATDMSNKYSKPGAYEVEPDGTLRKEVYVSDANSAGEMAIHRGNVYITERQYTDDEGNMSDNPVIKIMSFPLDNPKKIKEVFRTEGQDKIENFNIITYNENHCYVCMGEESGEEGVYKIDLSTGESTQICEGRGTLLKDRIVVRKMKKTNSAETPWATEYYQYTLDGKLEKQLTEDDFSAIGNSAELEGADDHYVYFEDTGFEGHEIEEGEQKMYVYTHEGENVCEIRLEDINMAHFFHLGNDEQMFLEEWHFENNKMEDYVWHSIDKNSLKGTEEPKIKEIIRGRERDYSGTSIFRH